MRRVAATALVLCLVCPVAPAFGHGGGLNRDGCLRETATGGYHCHRDSSDSDWKTAAVILGGLAVVGTVIWWWNKRRAASQSLTDLMPTSNERNMGVGYALDARGVPSVSAFWRIRF